MSEFEHTEAEYMAAKAAGHRAFDDKVKQCSCAHNMDGSVTTFLCPLHADTDPCLTMARVTGRRRKGTIKRGVCTSCGHGNKED